MLEKEASKYTFRVEALVNPSIGVPRQTLSYPSLFFHLSTKAENVLCIRILTCFAFAVSIMFKMAQKSLILNFLLIFAGKLKMEWKIGGILHQT